MCNMKLRKLRDLWFSLGALALAAFFFVGCEGLNRPVYPEPDVSRSTGNDESDKLRIGDTVRIEYASESTATPLQPFEEQIKDDGTISPPSVGSVQAVGKTTGELQKELQQAYRKFYVSMTITVKAPDRYYSVGGEVKLPNRHVYVGGTTVIKAIQSSGDFTEYAKRTKVQLRRANGRTYTIDCEKALKDPRLDLPVYPGDSIHVPQRRF